MLKYIVPLLVCLLIFSCKKEKTTWDSNWTAPIVQGQLTLNDLISDDYQATNSDGYISLVYNEVVYSFSLDTLIDLPDTTVLAKSAVGVPSVNVTPGFSYGDTYDQDYELGQIELKEVLIKSGLATVIIRSPWPGKSTVEFSFPSMTKLGIPLERSYNLDAGSIADMSEASENIDLANYLMNLTGSDGNQINTLEAFLTMGSNEPSDSYTITNSDSVEYEISFKDLVPDYARGYFGSYLFTDTTGVKLPFMDKVLAGNIDLDSIDLNLTIRNGFNLIAQAEISKITGINTKTMNSVDLTFPLLNNNVNINPASGGYYDFVASEYPFEINNSNSNILDFIENLSDSIALGYSLNINPFGNTSGGHDEFFPGSTFDLYLNGEFPMSFGASGLTLTDTFDIDYGITGGVRPTNGNIAISYVNGFPLEAQAIFHLIDENNVVIDSLVATSIINSGVYNNTTYATSASSGTVIFTLSEEQVSNLEETKAMIMYVAFSTEGGSKIKITADAFFDFKVSSNLNVNIAL